MYVAYERLLRIAWVSDAKVEQFIISLGPMCGTCQLSSLPELSVLTRITTHGKLHSCCIATTRTRTPSMGCM
jgi:hypothetical protein